MSDSDPRKRRADADEKRLSQYSKKTLCKYIANFAPFGIMWHNLDVVDQHIKALELQALYPKLRAASKAITPAVMKRLDKGIRRKGDLAKVRNWRKLHVRVEHLTKAVEPLLKGEQ